MSAEIGWSLEDLLPHRAPMILIDAVRDSDFADLEATVRVTEDSLFYTSPMGVPSYVGIEYVAQTVAALAGLRARRHGADVSLGYLLGARRFVATVPYFSLGSLLIVRVKAEFESRDLAKYRGEIVNFEGETLVSTSVTVYQAAEEQPT